MQALDALILSQAYTSETAQGMGAIKGRNCRVKGYSQDDDNKRTVITFAWYDDDGNVLKELPVPVSYGKDGTKGADGLNGKDGADGKDGDTITVESVALVSETSTTSTWRMNFSDGSHSDFVTHNGNDGKSAYEVARSNGFSGTEEQWLESLKGGQEFDEIGAIDVVNMWNSVPSV